MAGIRAYLDQQHIWLPPLQISPLHLSLLDLINLHHQINIKLTKI